MPDLIDDLAGLIGGRPIFIAVALLAVPGIRRQIRPVAKAALRTGIAFGGKFMEFVAEAREQVDDLMAEAKAELEENHRMPAPAETPPARRRSATAEREPDNA